MSENDFNIRWHALYDQGYIQTDWFIHNEGALKFSASWTKKPSFQGFAAYYGLTGSELTAKNNDFVRQGLRLDHLIGYEDHGVRYAAIWVRSSANRSFTISSNGSEYQNTYNQMAGQKHCQLHKLSSFGDDSFAAIWTCS
jgi:hypothetical protein